MEEKTSRRQRRGTRGGSCEELVMAMEEAGGRPREGSSCAGRDDRKLERRCSSVAPELLHMLKLIAIAIPTAL